MTRSKPRPPTGATGPDGDAPMAPSAVAAGAKLSTAEGTALLHAKLLAADLTMIANELEHPATAAHRRKELVEIIERTRAEFRGHSDPYVGVRRDLLRAIDWAAIDREKLRRVVEALEPERRERVKPFLAPFLERSAESVALDMFGTLHPHFRGQVEVNLSNLREVVEAWPGRRGPGKGNMPKGPGKWDRVRELLVKCKLVSASITASAIEKEWERRPMNPTDARNMPQSVTFAGLAEVADMLGPPKGFVDELRTSADAFARLEHQSRK